MVSRGSTLLCLYIYYNLYKAVFTAITVLRDMYIKYNIKPYKPFFYSEFSVLKPVTRFPSVSVTEFVRPGSNGTQLIYGFPSM